jgi:hypothetical protein
MFQIGNDKIMNIVSINNVKKIELFFIQFLEFKSEIKYSKDNFPLEIEDMSRSGVKNRHFAFK